MTQWLFNTADETGIRIDSDRYWLYAAVEPRTNEFLHVDVFPTQTTQFTLVFLRELREKHHIEQSLFLVDQAGHLSAALSRLGLRFQASRHGNRNAVERIFRETKRRTCSFSNTSRNAESTAVESWLRAFAVCLNQNGYDIVATTGQGEFKSTDWVTLPKIAFPVGERFRPATTIYRTSCSVA